MILIGMAPFSVFISEFQMIKAAVDADRLLVVFIFLAGTGIIFVGALRYAISIGFGQSADNIEPIPYRKTDAFLVAAPLAVLLILGLWMPQSFQSALLRAARIVQTVSTVLPIQQLPGGK